MASGNGKVKPVFWTSFFDQKKTVEALTEESRADSDFYLFLAGSTMITTLGLIMDSAIVVIGGMLVAPLLFPILSLGMGVATSSADAIMRSIVTIGKSIALVTAVSLSIAFLMNGNEITSVMQLASEATISHFLIAFTSGIVASYAWVKQNVNGQLPGVAVSVSLIPPIATFGVGLSMFERTITSGSMFLFLLNLLGIVFASIIVFSLFGFSNMHRIQEKVIKEEREEKEELKNGDK